MGQEQSSLGGSYDGGDADIHSSQSSNRDRSINGLQRRLEEEEKIDIYDTRVSKALLDLLATIHDEDETLPWNQSHDARAAALSATAQEFVPGKIFDGSSARSSTKSTPLAKPSPDPSSAASTAAAAAAAAAEKLNASAPEFVPSKIGQSVTAERKSSTVSADKKIWYYKDPSGTVRGPFSTTDMRVWSDKNYFDESLEVAREEKGPFIPLGDVYNKEGYFSRVMEAKEFLTRVQAINARKQQAVQLQLQRQLQEQLEKKGAADLLQKKLEKERPQRDSTDSSTSSPKKKKP